MEIYVGVLVRSNIARRQDPITFLLHKHHYHKKLYIDYYIIFINKISKITFL